MTMRNAIGPSRKPAISQFPHGRFFAAAIAGVPNKKSKKKNMVPVFHPLIHSFIRARG